MSVERPRLGACAASPLVHARWGPERARGAAHARCGRRRPGRAVARVAARCRGGREGGGVGPTGPVRLGPVPPGLVGVGRVGPRAMEAGRWGSGVPGSPDGPAPAFAARVRTFFKLGSKKKQKKQQRQQQRQQQQRGQGLLPRPGPGPGSGRRGSPRTTLLPAPPTPPTPATPPSPATPPARPGYRLHPKELGKLHRAAWDGDTFRVQHLLLLRKHDLDQPDRANRTPLHLACAKGFPEVVSLLVENKCKLNLFDSDNQSPLMKAIECQKEQCAIILLDHDADPNLVDAKHNTALHYAALIPNVSLAGHLLEHRAHIDVQNQEGYTPLLLAVIQNHQEMVEFLLKKGADVNARDNFKRTALILAAKGEQTGMIKLLLEHNADTYLEDDQGWTAENHATFSGFHAHSLLIAQYALQKNPKQCSSSIFNSPDRAFVSGFTLGGPATDKKGMDESSSESLSRASNKPSPSDSWPPSDEEESDFSTKKPAKPNLSRLINASQQIKKDDEKSSLVRTERITFLGPSMSSSEKEDVTESPPKPSPHVQCIPHPVLPLPGSFSKPPLMTSTPLLNIKKEESVETEDEEENSGNSSDDAPKEQPHSFKSLTKSLNSSTGYLKTQNTSQNCALGGDILPELGVEEEEESWKSESASESTPERSVPHLPAARSNEPTNSISKEKSEDIFYEPSFVSGSRNCNMNKLEDVRNLGRPVDHMDNYENHPVSKSNTTKAVVSKDSVNQEEEQMVKQNRTSDFMEEFGLDNADDIEDASDWDSTDTSYKNSQNVPQYSPEVKRAQKDSNGDLEDATISSSSRHSEKSPVPKNSSEEAHEGLSGSIPQQVEEEKIKHKYDEMGTLEKRHESDKSVQEKMAKIPRQHSQINNTVSSKERSPLILSHWKSHDGHFAGGEGSKETPDQQKSAEKGIHKKSKEPAQMAVDGDLDDLTQSSDTATEEFDFPSLNTKNPMLLIEQLGVHCNDSAGLLQVQNAFLSCERSVEFEKGRYQLLLSKVELMKKEKKELQEELSETREIKSKLEHEKVEWESELSSLRFTLKQEEEKKLSMEIKYEKAREQLKRKEDQYCKELEMKQQLELTLRTLDLELRTVRNNLKQVEEERNDTQRQLSQEQSARALQDDILNNHIWRQKEIEAAQKTATHSSEIPDNHEKEKELQHINQKLQEEIAILKLEVDTARVQNQEKESRYVDENEALKEKNEDLQKELKLNEEALTKRMFQYNGQLTVLTAENAMLRSQMENEKQNKDRLETEMESYRSRLSTAIQEHEKSQVAKSDAERKFQRERDEWLRLQDKLNHDLSNLRDTNGVLSQHLSQAESKANGLENELHRLRDIIREKSLSLESAQRDLQQTQCQAKELERVCQNEKAQMTKFTVKQESMTERLAQLQSENALLRQQLEDAQNKGIVQDKVVNDVQVLFRDIVDKLHAESDKQILLVEERNKELTCKCSHLREQLYKSETQQADREATIRQLQQELADSLKKQSMSEASLEVTTRYRNDLEDEKQQLQKELDKIRNKMQESEELQMQYKRCNHELEDHVQKLEIENTTLEATIKQQTTRIELLQKEPQDSSSSENEKENLKKLNQIKRSLENRLEHEIKKNQELQKNIDGFQKDIKTMKKKQKEYEKRELNFQGESKYSHSKIDDQVNKLKIKIDGLSQKLEGATSKYSLLETTNQDLKEQLFSLQKNYEISEKIKRQLEEEMVNLKRYQEMNMFERSQMEQYKREVDEQAKQEIVKKLEEVNLFLQTQAASQETLEKLRENNNASLINQMETRIKDLEMELARLKNSSQNNTFQKDPTQAELERYRGLYNEESNIRKSLSSKLDRANERLAETNVKLLSERQKRRSLISSLTSSPVLEPTHLGNLSYSFVFNRGLDLGGSFLGATPSTPSSETTVETYLTKMRQELDRKITKELAEANTELQFATLRVSPQGSTDDSSRNPNCHRDPAARATQEYLDILKKNYMI
uniref:Uncharacterized protein n=1 Tax=Ornithorhynchus anatinus TaxID=9258 RepID=A0A6I8NEP2_ORNAN